MAAPPPADGALPHAAPSHLAASFASAPADGAPRLAGGDGDADALRARVDVFCDAAMQLVAKNVAIVPDVTMMAAEVHARLMLAAQQLAANNLPAAEYHCQVAVWLRPDCVEGFLGLAGVLMRKADVAGAHAVYAHAVRLKPASGAAWCGLAAAAAASGGGVDATLACFCEAVRVEPGCADAYVGLGSCMKEMGKLEEAEAHFAHAVRLRPCDARLHAFLAGILYERERLVECMHVYSAALQLDPCFAEVMNDMGNACRGLGRLEDAQCWYSACLAQHAATGNVAKPAVAIGHANLGAIHKLQNRPAEAAHCFDIAVRLQPENADAHAALGGTLKDVGQHELALASYRTALALRPDHAIRACFVHSLASVCSWDEFQAALAVLEAEVRALVAAGKATAVQPFHAMGYEMDAQLVLGLTRAHAAQVEVAAARLGVAAFAHPPARALSPAARLRVGFVSSDIGQHPLSHLMGSVFGLVDRSRIEVFLYALSAADGSPYRARIETETEHFINASALSVPELATRIHADGIQILADLNGYTKGAKTEVFALRPAPVQIAYMGFPATTGASFMDWLVTDRVVAPPSLAHCYSERLCRLPHCYFVNDYARSCPEALDEARRPSRAAVGLPPHAFIFSCSNQLYKVDPRIFDTWCAILRRVPGSVLWLLRFPPFGEARLRAEAARRGVAPERLVFTDVAPKEQHILRSGLADLFLDTPLVNAHTTGTDVLWSGVPMLTLPGERFASRVGASLLSALGCGDCILASRAEYEERAVELATQPDALRHLTARVRRNRRAMPCFWLTHPLFNTHKWVHNFDNALLSLWQLHERGDAARQLDLQDVTAQPRHGHGA